MKLVCPSCGAVHSAEAWQNDPVARQCLKLAGEMPHDVSSRCFAYLSLFRPAGAHQKSLQWKKVLRLLSELKELVTLPYIQWEKKVARPNSAHAWGTAMERMIEHPPKRLPLKSHGYLRSVAYEICDDLDKQQEVKRNKAERTRNPSSPPAAPGRARRACALSQQEHGGSATPRQGITAEDMKTIRRKNFQKR